MLASVSASEQTANALRELLAQNDPLPALLAENQNDINNGFLFARMLDLGFTGRVNRLMQSAAPASALFAESLLALRQGDVELARQKLSSASEADNEYTEAKSLLLKTWAPRVLAGNAPEAILALIPSLPVAEQAVFQAWPMKQQAAWAELAKLETALAKVMHDSPWYSEAAQLRGYGACTATRATGVGSAFKKPCKL